MRVKADYAFVGVHFWTGWVAGGEGLVVPWSARHSDPCC